MPDYHGKIYDILLTETVSLFTFLGFKIFWLVIYGFLRGPFFGLRIYSLCLLQTNR